jgi:hypothetical protein
VRGKLGDRASLFEILFAGDGVCQPFGKRDLDGHRPLKQQVEPQRDLPEAPFAELMVEAITTVEDLGDDVAGLGRLG